MKTLILNGSPRKNGDTVSLINNRGFEGRLYDCRCIFRNVIIDVINKYKLG